MNAKTNMESGLTRRDFMKKTATGLAGLGFLASTNFAYAGGSDRIRVGVIGCGGRGTGAANNALTADPAIEIHAMGDMFLNRLEDSRQALRNAGGDRVNVPDERRFVGLDSYLKVMESGIDVVFLTTPPGFRPMHLRAAVDHDLHIFFEKPVAVDPAGVRSVIEVGKEGRRKKLTMVGGTQYRRQPSFVEAVKSIHAGKIGDLASGSVYYMTGPVWMRERQPGMSDVEAQCLNWYYQTWLSGDHIVEQFVHNIDTCDWVFQTHPERAIGSGGRQVRTGENYGHIYDHFSVEYQYPNGARVTAMSRQMRGTATRVSNHFVGSRGIARIDPMNSVLTAHDGETLDRHRQPGNNPYVQTHVDLVASIRNGEPLDETRSVAESTLTAILGREAAYTGQELTWDEVFNADMNLFPADLESGTVPSYEVAMPGKTRLERNVSN